METFMVGDNVERRMSLTSTRGTVVAVHGDTVRVSWSHGFVEGGTTTTERPEDLRKLSR